MRGDIDLASDARAALKSCLIYAQLRAHPLGKSVEYAHIVDCANTQIKVDDL